MLVFICTLIYIVDDTPNRSSVAALVEEGKLLLKSERDYSIAHVRRSQYNVAHALAQMDRSSTRTAVWLRHGPDEIGTLCQEDYSEPLI